MEGISFSSEHDDDDEKAEAGSKSSSKSAENLGAFLVEPKDEKAEKPTKPSLFEEIFKREAAVETPVEDAVESQETAVAGSVEAPEFIEPLANAAEILEPLDQLTPAETVAVEQQIVQTRQVEAAAAEDDPDASAAIAAFHSKIVGQGMSSDEALIDTLDEIESDSAEQVPTVLPESTPASATQSEQQAEDSGSTPPPTPPTAFPAGPFGPPSSPSFESPSPTTAPNRAPEVVTVETRNPSDLLVGGIVGYLIGRRRGRIRTEKRLLPIQEKLEKQVKTMEANIIAKESAIRAAVQKNRDQSYAMTELQKTTEQLRQTSQKSPEVTVQLTHEEARRDQVETQKVEQQRNVRFAETLARPQLLAIAENILIDGVPLRQTFEANRISEDGLRRVVGEHLRGGDVSRALRLELVDGERAFERDPRLRDNPDMLPQPTTHSSQVHPPQPVISREEAQLQHQQATLLAQQEHQQVAERAKKQRQRVLDVTLAGVITILLLAIVGVVIARS